MPLLKIYKLEDGDDAVCALPAGEHVIGRGELLQCNDKRVSRKHAVINIFQERATITAVHINPCFFMAANSKTITILPKDSKVDLYDNDKFALLPDLFWFKVRIERDIKDDGNNASPLSSNNVAPDQSNFNVALTPTTSKRSASSEIDGGECKRLKINDETNRRTGSEVDDGTNSGGVEEIDHSEVNGETTKDGEEIRCEREDVEINLADAIVDNRTNEQTVTNSENSIANDHNNVEEIEVNDGAKEGTTKAERDNNQTEEPQEIEAKTSADQVIQPEDVPQEVVETNEVQPDVPDAGMEPANAPENAPEANPTTSNANDETNAASASTSKKRDRCWYGPTCYRKNPQHKSDFSHPGDNNYGDDPTDDRLNCPFGDVCYRRNKEHRRMYKHTSNPAPKPTGGGRKKRVTKQKKTVVDFNEDDSEDNEDYEDFEDDFSDGSSDNYEYFSGNTDSDSDWGDSETLAENTEETRRLVREAKRFLKDGKK